MKQTKTNDLPWLFAALALALHLIATLAGQYSIFRDELYYIACVNHPALGYVDHPPLSVWILAIWKWFAGDSLFSIRFLPALFGALSIFYICRIARELGGGRFAQILATTTALLAPIYLAFFGLYSMNALDVLLWAMVFLTLIRITTTGKIRDWYILGILLGLGALNKLSMVWLASGIAVAMVMTPTRTALKTRGPWAAMGFAVLLFLTGQKMSQ
ncbi:glycosyltransferase family 39 protein [candidate division KSB1 bacterium]|nr:glycosyltransferase family 39 protein [candidate division KSB1 bacterium]